MKLRNIVYGMLCMGALASCSDQMNYHEYNNYDEDFVKLNFGNVGGLVTTIYLDLDTDFGNYSGAVMGSATDESQYAYTGNSIETFYNGAWSPINAQSGTWNTCYSGISNCNLFLDKYLGLTFPELEQNADYKPQMFRYNNYQYEVRFLRAYFYFNLVRQYGDVPFTDHFMSADESNSLGRTPAKDIFDYIISECDEIKDLIIEDYANLPADVVLPSESPETGRVNKATVLALKARAALYAASPLFNTENNPELWHRAATANKELLDYCVNNRGMKLVDDYASLWDKNNYKNATDELIFGRRANKESSSMESYNYPAGIEGGKGGNCPTQNLVDAYETTDGYPVRLVDGVWKAKGSTVFNPAKPYENRDPRLKMTICVNEEVKWPTWNETPIYTYQGGANGQPLNGGTPTGYYLKKYCQGDIDLRSNSTYKSAYHTWITYRLGEFYLNYAEAVFRYLGNADATDAEFTMSARQAASMTRERKGVNMPAFPLRMSNEDFWEAYKKERMVELAFEGHRFWDVRRWKEADKYFSSVDGLQITKTGDNADGTGIYSYAIVKNTRQWDDKMYFFPIPQSERMKNPNLGQNPGW